MFRTDILFTGFYGYQNTGDDAFIEVASWGANKFWNKDKNRFLGKHSKMPKTLIPNKGYPLEIKRTYSLQANLLLKNTDAFIFAGGSTIHSKLKSSNIRYKVIQKKKVNKKLKFGAIGVSIGPFKSGEDEKAVESYLRQMDFLAVRDQASYDLVRNIDNLPYNPINAFDLAALLPDIYGETVKNENVIKTIGISVCHYETLQIELNDNCELNRNMMVVELIKELDRQDDIHFKFYIINGNEKIGDRKLTFETITKSQPRSFEVYEYNRETKKVWESIAKCDFVISTRLHAAIFACFSNTPFMLNEYHRKCGDFLENVNYDNSYRLYNSEYDIKERANQIISIVNNNNAYVAPSKIEEMKALALLNFTEITL